jgi:hypothetical protein
MSPKQNNPSSSERMGFSVYPLPGSPAAGLWRAGGFASHSLERFAFFLLYLMSNFYATILEKT